MNRISFVMRDFGAIDADAIVSVVLLDGIVLGFTLKNFEGSFVCCL